MAFAAAFLVILLVAPSAFAAQYPVDWKLGADYSTWTTKALNAGDTLGKCSCNALDSVASNFRCCFQVATVSQKNSWISAHLTLNLYSELLQQNISKEAFRVQVEFTSVNSLTRDLNQSS